MSKRDPRLNHCRYRAVLQQSSPNSEMINPHRNDESPRNPNGVVEYNMTDSTDYHSIVSKIEHLSLEDLSRPVEICVPSYQIPSRPSSPMDLISSFSTMKVSDHTSLSSIPPNSGQSIAKRLSNSPQTSNRVEFKHKTHVTKRMPRRFTCHLDRYIYPFTVFLLRELHNHFAHKMKVPYLLGKPEHIRNALYRLIKVTKHIPNLDVNQAFIDNYLQGVFENNLSPITIDETSGEENSST